MDVGLDLAPLRTLAPRVVEVVHHDHARRGNGLDEVPPAEEARPMPLDRTVLGTDDGGAGVAHHRPHLGEERLDVGGEIALLARPHVERLDGIGDAGARDLLECVDLLGGQRHVGSPLLRAASTAARVGSTVYIGAGSTGPGCLRPWPVTTQTTRSVALMRPSRRRRRATATEAAADGSQ